MVLTLVAATNGMVSPVSAAAGTAPPQSLQDAVRVKRMPAGSIEIDPSSLADGGRQIAVDAVPSAGLRDPQVTVTSTGAVAVGGGARSIGEATATSLDVSVALPVGAGRITATMNGVDAAGHQLAVSDTVWVDTVAGTTVVSTTGTQDLQLQVIDLRAAKGLLAPEQAEAARRQALGGTNSRVTISPSATCAQVCISGLVLWTDSAGNTHVVRKAPVWIMDANAGPDSFVDETVTDDTGHFTIEVNNTDPEGGARDIYVDVYAAGPGFNINDHYIESSVTNNIATGTNLVTNFTANNVADNNTAFSLQNAMVVAGEYVQGVRGSAFPGILVEFPSPGGGSYYDGISLKVDGLDRWDWDVMLHEYGHYVADLLNIESNPGGSHSNTNLSDTKGKDVGTRLAFGEGWPTYFAVSALREMGTASLNIPNIGDTSYQDTEDQVLTDNLEIGETLGEDNENTIQSILWDLYDAPVDGIDRVAMGTDAIWDLLDAGNPASWRLSTAYPLFAPGASATENDRNCIFSQQNVSPRLAGAESVSLGAAPASPTLTWSRGNGGNYPNNQFEVQYRDSTGGTLLFTSGTITALTYTAPSPDWADAVAASDGTIVVSVIGTQTNTPATGPYRSCAKTFDLTVATYTPLVPARLMDTRPTGLTADDVRGPASISTPGTTTELPVGGRVEIPTNAIAVALNVTVVSPQGSGFATVWPCGTTQPNASNLNFVAGKNIPNSVITKLGVDGKVCFATSKTTHLIADVAGYYPAGSTFVPLDPGRLLDTRSSGLTVDGISDAEGLQPAGVPYELEVGGRYSIPSDASAVVLNVTVTGPQIGGFATVWPCGTTKPNASNLNFTAGRTIPNLVITKLGAAGKVCISATATTHLIADVSGYYPAGSGYTPIVPERFLDTRASGQTIDNDFEATGALAAGGTGDLLVGGRGSVPADASAVVLNVTVTSPQTGGFVTVWPCGTPQPNASNLNFSAGTTIANLVIAKVGVDGYVCINTTATTHVIADVSGYYP
ncbi:MAG: hypothetical protein ABMA25_03465 [Ilumatobacteraceae bacterium]